MIYNFNLGIGWASSGVEYAQIYRAKMLRNIGEKAKFIFTDMFPRDNIQHLTANIGFKDDEIIWLYTYFTDTKIAPVSFTLKDLEKTFGGRDFIFKRDGAICKYYLTNTTTRYTVYMVNDRDDLVHRVEIVSNDCLIRKDYYTYCKIFSEYYAPLDGRAYLYQRRFFNEDGTTAYEEVIDGDNAIYKFPDRILYSKPELVAFLTQSLGIKDGDIVIIDRTTGIGQSVLQNAKPAKVGIVIHADHFSESSTDDETILWNNYYEYDFAMNKHIDFYIASTDAQRDLVKAHFKKYLKVDPNVVTIPVGGLTNLKYSDERKPYSLITASRLAGEKHVDWLVDAVIEAKKSIPQLVFDIYGYGGEEASLKKQIEEANASSYIRMCGHKKLDDTYCQYQAYVAGSTSEGFGLTLMEAVGSGLPIIGFDVRYGNPTFINDGESGYLIPYSDTLDRKQKVDALADRIIKLFTDADLESFRNRAYDTGRMYLQREVESKWATLINQMKK